MDIEWDDRKRLSNEAKHDVDFKDCEPVFYDEHAIVTTSQDRNEERFLVIGMDACLRVIVLVYCYRGDAIRIISARKATKRERKTYEG